MNLEDRPGVWLAAYFKARDRVGWLAALEKTPIEEIRHDAALEADLLLAEYDKRFPADPGDAKEGKDG